MQKVEEAIRLREKKSERRILLATIAAAIFLIGVSGTGLVLYFGDSIREAFTPTTLPQSESIQIPCFYLLLILTIPLFILFDRWMRNCISNITLLSFQSSERKRGCLLLEDIPVSVYINSFSLVYESPVPNATSAQTKLSWEA